MKLNYTIQVCNESRELFSLLNFCANSQFHSEKANGEYIFGLDADEIPHEFLIKNVKRIIEEFIKDHGFKINELSWINWSDFQMRIYKKCDYIKWTEEMHTKLTGTDKITGLQQQLSPTLWHIITSNDNLYDKLM